MALTAASAATSEVIAFAGGTVAGFGNVFQTIGSGWTSVNTDNSAGNYGVTFEAFAGAKSNAEWANTLDPSSTDTYNGSYTVGVALEIVAASGAVTDTGSSRPFARPGLDVGTPRSQLRSPLRLDTGTTPPPFIDQTAGAPSRRLRLGTPGSRLKSPVLDTGTTAPPFIDQTAGMPPRKLRLGTPASRLRSPVLDTGAAASAPNNYLVAAIAGSYAYAGQSASVLLGKLVTAASGSYTYTGQNATLLKSKVVAAVAGSYLISGQAASLLKSNLVTATSGAYTINGQSATITYTPAGHYTVVASAGSYTYTGQSAGILHGSLIAAAAGSYAYSGQSVGIAHNLLVTAASGSYSYAGQSATITYTPVSGAYTVTAIAGSYAISGQDAIITRTGGAQPSGGYGWYSYVRFEQESLRRRKKREEAERLAQEAEQAQQSEIEAELARRLHAELARQAELDDLQRLRMLVARESVPSNVSERVKTAFVKAQAESSFSRLQALAREMERSLEEEEMALLMLLMEES
jgi:hypothetical protein